MYQATSVRTEGNAQNTRATGLRFMTLATDFKEDLNAVYSTSLYSYRWYTELRFKRWEGETYDKQVKVNGVYETVAVKVYESYELTVAAKAWHETGWNTLLMDIPALTQADVDAGFSANTALDITAQSFVEIRDKATGDIVYAADSDTYQTVKLTFDAKYTRKFCGETALRS